MTQIRIDRIAFASFIETYINYRTLTTNVILSGTLADGAEQTFTGTIPYTRGKTRADLYARNSGTGKKMPMSGGARINPYQSTAGEYCSQSATYDGSNITVRFTVTNFTGGTVSFNQTFVVSAVLYEVPYSQS